MKEMKKLNKIKMNNQKQKMIKYLKDAHQECLQFNNNHWKSKIINFKMNQMK